MGRKGFCPFWPGRPKEYNRVVGPLFPWSTHWRGPRDLSAMALFLAGLHPTTMLPRRLHADTGFLLMSFLSRFTHLELCIIAQGKHALRVSKPSKAPLQGPFIKGPCWVQPSLSRGLSGSSSSHSKMLPHNRVPALSFHASSQRSNRTNHFNLTWHAIQYLVCLWLSAVMILALLSTRKGDGRLLTFSPSTHKHRELLRAPPGGSDHACRMLQWLLSSDNRFEIS